MRLKRSVDLFPAADGSLYLLRLGAGDDLVIRSPSPAERTLLAELEGGFRSAEDLRAALAGQDLEDGGLEAALDDLAAAGVLEVCAEAGGGLSHRQRERFDRQLIYFAELTTPGQPAEELQMRLTGASVVVLGCGGLGSWVACALACAGVGSLVLIDDDRVELSNLNRQMLFTEAEVGELKVESAARALRAHNREVDVVTIAQRIEGRGDLADVLAARPSLVVATADWPPHELPRWVNDACVAASVPWIGAGQFPPRLRVGPLVVPGESACWGCLEVQARREHPLYEEVARWRAQRQTPDSSVGPVSAVIGGLLATEAMHFLLGAFPPASLNHVLLMDLWTMSLVREPLRVDRRCSVCGDGKLA